jgi:flavin-dependent dehydrogenase
VLAQVAEWRLSRSESAACRVLPERPELYFSRDLRGYGWCFRKGAHLNLGIGRRDPHDFGRHVRGFVEFLQQSGRLGFEPPGRWRGHAYAVREAPARAVAGDALLLVGDAAALAVPESGEGLRPALWSGLLAAETLLAARDGWSREALGPYEAALRGRLGEPPRHRPLPAALARLLSLPLGNSLVARHLVLDRWFLREARAA